MYVSPTKSILLDEVLEAHPLQSWSKACALKRGRQGNWHFCRGRQREDCKLRGIRAAVARIRQGNMQIDHHNNIQPEASDVQ